MVVCTPKIPVVWRWRQEGQELKVILSYPGQPGRQREKVWKRLEAAMAHIYNYRTQEAMAEGLHGKAGLGCSMSSRPTGAERHYQKGGNRGRDVPHMH